MPQGTDESCHKQLRPLTYIRLVKRRPIHAHRHGHSQPNIAETDCQATN
jgi:hypothetical protein